VVKGEIVFYVFACVTNLYGPV